MLWCLDFLVELCGGRLTGLTAYMADPNRSLFLRGLSLFHGWLPFLVYYLVKKLGYDRRALVGWIAIASRLPGRVLFSSAARRCRATRRPRATSITFSDSMTGHNDCFHHSSISVPGRVPDHHYPLADPLSAAEALSAARTRTLSDKITWARRASRACTPALSQESRLRSAEIDPGFVFHQPRFGGKPFGLRPATH